MVICQSSELGWEVTVELPTEPSRAADLGGGTLTMDQVIQIITAATRQAHEPPEE